MHFGGLHYLGFGCRILVNSMGRHLIARKGFKMSASVSSLVGVGGVVSVRSLLRRSGSFDVARFGSDDDRITAIMNTVCKRARNEYRVLIDCWDFDRCLRSVGIHDI